MVNPRMRIRRPHAEWVALALALVLLSSFLAYSHLSDIATVDATERDRLQVQTRGIAEDINRNLQAANLSLDSVLRDYFRSPAGAAPPSDVSRRLRALVGAVPGIRDMAVLDAGGTATSASTPATIGQNFSHRDYFQHARARPDAVTLYVSQPFKSVRNDTVIVLARMVSDSHADFGGLVVASLDPQYFTSILGPAIYAPDVWAYVVHGDGQQILNIPARPGDGTNLNRPDTLFSRHLQSGQEGSVLTGTVFTTGELRLMALRTIRPRELAMDKALVVGLSRDLAVIARPLNRQALVYCAFVAALTIACCLGLRGVQVKRAEQEAAAAAREQLQALLQLEHTVARGLANADDLYVGIESVLRALGESQQWTLGRCWEADEAAGVLRFLAFWSASGSVPETVVEQARRVVLRAGEGLAGTVWQTGQPMWIADLRNDLRVVDASMVPWGEPCSACILPVVAHDRTVGIMSFVSPHAREPDEDLLASARAVGKQLGQFIRRKQAEAALEASESFNRSTLDSLLEHVCVLDSTGVIVGVNRAWLEFAAANGAEPMRTAPGANYIEICDGATGSEMAEARAFAAGIRDVLAGQRTTFAMEYSCDSPFEKRWFVGRVSRFIGGAPLRVVVAHENISTRKAAEERIAYLNRVHTTLSGINQLIVRVTDRTELFQEACRIAVDIGGFHLALICIADRQLMAPVPVAWAGDDKELISAVTRFLASSEGSLLGQSMTAQAIRSKKPMVANDSVSDPNVLFRQQHEKSGIRSMAILPLMVADEAIGVFALYSRQRDLFHDEEMALLIELAGDIAFAIAHIEKQERLDYLAYYDPITELANRALFLDRLKRELDSPTSKGHQVGVVLGDLKRFRMINETFGRTRGDQVLVEVARRLKESALYPDNLARLHGDCFAVFVPGLTSTALAGRIHDLLNGPLARPFSVGETSVNLEATIGAAVFPHDGTEPEALITNAEAALRKAKETGQPYLFYEAALNAKVSESLRMESKLRNALEQRQFVLHYQPKIAAEGGAVQSVEALIRWNDPDQGLVPPARFIPLMEETGLIREVGAWALTQAVADINRWSAMGLRAPRCAVNVSPLQLRDRGFAESVIDALAGLGSAEPLLDIEITETEIMQNVGQTVTLLQTLRGVGVEIAIDDFGTGYSSLAYLARLPVNTLKIDRAFVQAIGKQDTGVSIVSAIISLAHSLRLKVVAEGVETQEQADTLRELQCDLLQGFLFSKAVPFEEIVPMLALAR